MEKKHRNNLLKLANYLDKLPKDYQEKHFKMTTFFAGEFTFIRREPKEYKNVCGTTACACGHGPAAGIAVSKHDGTWSNYMLRVFGVSLNSSYDGGYDAGCYMFGADWPNDAQEAARRIRNYVYTGATSDD